MANLENASNVVEGKAKPVGNTCPYWQVALTKHYAYVSSAKLLDRSCDGALIKIRLFLALKSIYRK